MARHFKDWITAYAEYAQDAFCPPKFHMWTGFSTLAGALERRVWAHRGSFDLYPNIYVLLVAKPGIGKSASSAVGMGEFLRQLGTGNDAVHFTASQNSDASFAKQFESYKVFHVKGQPHTHSSKFFYASEASNSLKEIVGGGEVTAALTEFYDCPSHFNKTLMGYDVRLKNVCCNMLAGCTFEYLAKLVPEAQSGGGFASRMIYVVQDELMIRRPKWLAPGRHAEIRNKLLSDLQSIYELAGPFDPLPEFTEAWETWFPEQDAHTQSLGSERMQHFLARKHTNIVKLAMLCSVSESRDLILRKSHWDRALELMETVELDLPNIVTRAVDTRTQKGLNYLILKALCDEGQNGVLEKAHLLRILGVRGADVGKIEHTLKFMHDSNMIRIDVSGVGKFRCQLLVDAKDYL